jgi:hypothetical protein
MKQPIRTAFVALIFFYLSIDADATAYYSRMSGPWTSSSTWSLTSGGAAISSGYPGAGDDVIIEGGFTVTIAASGVQHVYAANVFIGGNSTSGTLSYPNGNPPSTLTVTGDVTIGGSGASATGTLSYGSWGLTITCSRLLKGTGNANRTNALQQDFTFTGTFTLPIGFNQFRNFIVDGGTVTLSENIETNGSVSPAINAGSTLNLQTYTIDIGGYKNFNIYGTLIVGGNAGGFGNSNFPSNFDNLTIGNSSTVIYSYPGNQTIYPATYQHLTISGSGIKTMGYLGYVSGLTLTNGGSGYSCDAEITFSGGGGTGATGEGYNFGDPGDPISYLNITNGGSGYTSTPTVTISGNCGGSGATATASITIVNTATINGKLSIGGSATLSGTPVVYGAAATLEYTGSVAKTTGAEFPATWSGSGGVIINNSAGVTLNAGKTISSTLTLTNGILTTSTGNLLTISNTATSAISGGSSNSYINGPVAITLPANLSTGSSYTLPVGKTAAYLPLVLVNPTTTTGVITATVEAFNANSGGSANGTDLLAISGTEYWSLTTTGNFSGSSISLTRSAAPDGINLIGKSATVNGVYSSLGGTVSGSSVINSTNTGPVASLFLVLGSDYSLLPVIMPVLTASEQPGGILVKWTTHHELNIDRFEIEKSFNGQHYTSVSSLVAKGNSSMPVNYHWLDANAVNGNNYYRIKIISQNGEAQYTHVIKVALIKQTMSMQVYPNPVTGNTISVELVNLEKDMYRATIINQMGQLIYSRSIDHAGGSATFTLQTGNAVAAGVYQLRLSGKTIHKTQWILKN